MAVKEAGVQAAKDVWLEHPLFVPAREQPAVAARLAEMVSAYSGWHWVAAANPERVLDPPAAQQLSTISAPTLIVVGERDLPDFLAIAAMLEQHIPNGRKVVMPGVGHMSNMENPEGFNQIVLSFLVGQ